MDIEEYKSTPLSTVLNPDFHSTQIDTTVEDFLKEFHKRENKEQAIAVFDDKKFIGIVDPPNLIKLLVQKDKIADETILNPRGVDFSYFPKTVGDMAARHGITMEPSKTVTEAATKMVKRNIQILPIVEDGKLLGTVRAERLFNKLENI